jgi:LCP family protein required for cell wall assembly
MKKRNLIITILVVVILGGFAAGIPLYKKWNQPLGESLQLPTLTPAEVDNFVPEATPTDFQPVEEQGSTPDASEPTALPPTDTPIPTATIEPLCGGPATMTVLALGVDSGGDNDYLYGLADVIKLVRIDFVTPKVTVMSLPRDLWVQIPGLQEHGVTEGKLNQSYFFGTKGMGYYDGPGGAPGLMARTLQENFDLTVDHYGTVNMVTFVKMVDAVGGVDVYLPYDVDGRPVDDKTEDMGYFYSGVNHLTGEAALRLSRVRKTDSIFARMDRQKTVLCALKDKVLQPAVLPKIPELIAAFQGSIVTDLSPAQMTQMACLLPKLSSENIIFGGIPEEELTQSRQWDARGGYETFVWDIDNQKVRDYIAQFMAGSFPVAGESAGCPPPVNVEQ